jgi:hypothetical protein
MEQQVLEMPRTPARFTQAEISRAAKVAVANGLRLRMTKAGDIVLEPFKTEGQEQPPLDTEARCAF